ncbi:MAG TPA: type II toxin-antitoxin system RelB/DinJ family antitoxin [Halothiobacillus sp.]|nr:type II toxin-antitoxin system RelB/DinJ family antitoxin [Halothiobacillus sp.]
MSMNTVVRARIDPQIKDEASAVLAATGLTLYDTFRIMLTRVAHEKALPFDPLTPNGTTSAARRVQAISSAWIVSGCLWLIWRQKTERTGAIQFYHPTGLNKGWCS